MDQMERIDVHAHCVPPAFREYCLKNGMAGYGHPDGMPAIPEWSMEAHLELMDRLHITKSILSVSSPGTHLTPGDDDEARKLTRRINEDIAEICRKEPSRFAFFASLPLPDVEGSLAEIDYAIDQLGAVGFQILTNSHGVYPGDASFAPVFTKLNERKALVFFHPTSCRIRSASGALTEAKALPRIPFPMLEFPFDSTRAIMSLLLSHSLKRCPDITVIACHCGSALPPLLERIAEFSGPLLGPEQALSSDDVKKLFQTRFYFDLAGFPFPDQIHGLLRLVDVSRLLYGSDYPYTPASMVQGLASQMDKGLAEELHSDVRHQVYKQNALEMLSKASTT